MLQAHSISGSPCCLAFSVSPVHWYHCHYVFAVLPLNLKRALTGSKARIRALKYSLPSTWAPSSPLLFSQMSEILTLYHILVHLSTGPVRFSSDWIMGVGLDIILRTGFLYPVIESS